MTNKSEVAKKNRPNIPSDYKEQSSDILGFWDSLSGDTIHMIPRFVRLFDSKIDASKPSTLLVAELVEPIEIKDANDKTFVADKGSLVGIWTKAGMSDIKHLGGQDVYMYQDGTKEMGKGQNPMFLYKILSRTKGTKLPVHGDFRKKSLPTGVTPIASPDDDLPF